MDLHLLNLTETITVSENESAKISVSDDENNVFSYQKNMKAKVVQRTYVCNSPVNIDSAVEGCKKCDNATSQSLRKSKPDVKMVVCG